MGLGVANFLVFKGQSGDPRCVSRRRFKGQQDNVAAQAGHVTLPAGDQPEFAKRIINLIPDYKRQVGMGLKVGE